MHGCEDLPPLFSCVDNNHYTAGQVSEVSPISAIPRMALSGQDNPCSGHSCSTPRVCEVHLRNQCWLFIFPWFSWEDLQLVQFIAVFFWKLELSFWRLWLFCWPFVSMQDFFLMESTRGELNLSMNQDVLTSYSPFSLTNYSCRVGRKIFSSFPQSPWAASSSPAPAARSSFANERIAQPCANAHKNIAHKKILVINQLHKHSCQKMQWNICKPHCCRLPSTQLGVQKNV